LVADDHDLVRRGLKRILADAAGVAVVAEARAAGDVLHLVRTCPADILLLDLNMPGVNGLELLDTVRREAPRLRVLVLSLHAEDQFAGRVLAAGASGYLTKETAPDELVDAVRIAHAGGRYVSGERTLPVRDYPAITFTRPPRPTARRPARGKA
jgi:DNA-binding NarL/FixJ family response regulator